MKFCVKLCKKVKEMSYLVWTASRKLSTLSFLNGPLQFCRLGEQGVHFNLDFSLPLTIKCAQEVEIDGTLLVDCALVISINCFQLRHILQQWVKRLQLGIRLLLCCLQNNHI